jgi:hypothetical protein
MTILWCIFGCGRQADRIKVLEKKAGEAVLRALVLHQFEDDLDSG